MAKRSAALKQFLLRVHPDHFRNLPAVHDENLQSVKLLNQFMDDRHAAAAHHRPREKVFFSVLVPALSANTKEKEEEEKKLKRFPLVLTHSIEAKMIAILQECGVAIEDTATEENASSSAEDFKARSEKKRAGGEHWHSGRRHPSGMDFGGFTMEEMYAKANRAAASRRRKRPIHSLKELLEYMREEETMEIQQQREIAWQSVESVKRTLKREIGLENVLCSCGWGTLHLNTTVMILLQTLRKYTRANKEGIFTPKDFLHGATIDISSNPSGIDFSNEYRIGLNPADVPVQWVQVLETIDENVVMFMRAARKSLASLQSDATAALGEAHITRGYTCPALGYRTFLQSMKQGSDNADYNEQGLLEKFNFVVEDSSYDWNILETGQVRAPFATSYEDAVQFLNQNRSKIRQQLDAHDANLEAFAYISARCTYAMHIKSITYSEGIPVADAIVACEELLNSVVGMSAQIPQEVVRFLDTYTQGRRICIDRTFGLGQDGIYTLPVDWFKY